MALVQVAQCQHRRIRGEHKQRPAGGLRQRGAEGGFVLRMNLNRFVGQAGVPQPQRHFLRPQPGDDRTVDFAGQHLELDIPQPGNVPAVCDVVIDRDQDHR